MRGGGEDGGGEAYAESGAARQKGRREEASHGLGSARGMGRRWHGPGGGGEGKRNRKRELGWVLGFNYFSKEFEFNLV